MADITLTQDESEAEERPANATEPRLRDSDLFLILLAVCAGALAGLGVIIIDGALVALHWLAFGLSADGHLSDVADLPRLRVLMMPIIGGILVGAASALLRRWRPRQVSMRSRPMRCSAAGWHSATASASSR